MHDDAASGLNSRVSGSTLQLPGMETSCPSGSTAEKRLITIRLDLSASVSSSRSQKPQGNAIASSRCDLESCSRELCSLCRW